MKTILIIGLSFFGILVAGYAKDDFQLPQVDYKEMTKDKPAKDAKKPVLADQYDLNNDSDNGARSVASDDQGKEVEKPTEGLEQMKAEKMDFSEEVPVE